MMLFKSLGKLAFGGQLLMGKARYVKKVSAIKYHDELWTFVQILS